MEHDDRLNELIRKLVCSIKPYGDWSYIFKPEEPEYNFYTYRQAWLDFVTEKHHVRELIK